MCQITMGVDRFREIVKKARYLHTILEREGIKKHEICILGEVLAELYDIKKPEGGAA